MFLTLLQVALGGAMGASARFLVAQGVFRLAGPGFPLATMLINIFGSAAMGFLAVALTGSRWAPFVLTGILGGFTTFSAFSLDAVTLWCAGRYEAAAVYVLGSVAVSIAGLMLGLTIARGIFQ